MLKIEVLNLNRKSQYKIVLGVNAQILPILTLLNEMSFPPGSHRPPFCSSTKIHTSSKFPNGHRGTWVAKSVEWLTLNFGSSHDVTVCRTEPQIGLCIDSTGACLGFVLSLPLSPPPPLIHACAHTLSQHK